MNFCIFISLVGIKNIYGDDPKPYSWFRIWSFAILYNGWAWTTELWKYLELDIGFSNSLCIWIFPLFNNFINIRQYLFNPTRLFLEQSDYTIFLLLQNFDWSDHFTWHNYVQNIVLHWSLWNITDIILQHSETINNINTCMFTL